MNAGKTDGNWSLAGTSEITEGMRGEFHSCQGRTGVGVLVYRHEKPRKWRGESTELTFSDFCVWACI